VHNSAGECDCDCRRAHFLSGAEPGTDRRTLADECGTDILMIKETKKLAVWNWKIVKRAIVDSFTKLNPRAMMKNMVMFVVEVGSVLTTIQLVRGFVRPIPGVTSSGFELQITLWLWFTVLFANFAEAMAEGRGKAQADNLRRTRTETT